jgi:tRNA pseudouridine55 synthase
MNEADHPPLSQYDFPAGATLLIDKPQGWTSFDVVNIIRNRLRKLLGVKKIKVGHAGTLDPMATGLLIVCTGKATKTLANHQGLDKVYTGTIRLGATTPSYDAESAIDEVFPVDHIDEERLEQARRQFLGDIWQVPPMFSAIKVDGQPLYKRARKGEKIEVQARPVHIFSLEWTNMRLEMSEDHPYPEIDFRLHCSKGTYVRSLAFDLGKALDSGAYLTALRRTRVGHFDIQQAWDLDELVESLEARIEATAGLQS